MRACWSAGWGAAALPWCLGCGCRWSWAAESTQLWLGLGCTVCTVCHSPRGHSLTHSCCLDVSQRSHTCRQIRLLKIHFTDHPFQLSGWEQSFCPAALDNKNPISERWNVVLCCPLGKLLTCALCPPLCPTWGLAHSWPLAQSLCKQHWVAKLGVGRAPSALWSSSCLVPLWPVPLWKDWTQLAINGHLKIKIGTITFSCQTSQRSGSP